jgi:hypothetical protein
VTIRRNKCLLCHRKLEPVEGSLEFLQAHPQVDDCEVVYTDAWGVAVEVEEQPEAEQPAPIEPGDEIVFSIYPFVEDVIEEIFASYQLQRQGGASTGRGWTAVSIFQRCPYLWKRRYIDEARPAILIESPARAVGTLIHAFLAAYYTSMMEESPYRVITPEILYDRLILKANPELVKEGWRVFSAYRLWYQNEKLIPLAIEYDLKDPRTGDSCRYDLIAYLEEPSGGLLPGTYNIEHKSGSRFDHNFLEGWQNDGEVIGQNALWKMLGLDKRFGALRGTIVNLLGKQKEPKFHRTFVAPDSWRIQSHLDDLRRWEGLLNLARSAKSFPRARGNCIGRYGMCDWYEHCASND